MGERILERTIPSNFETQTGGQGVREDDSFVIEAFQERKKSLKLKRFRYLIKSGEAYSYDSIKGEITLPVFDNNQFEFELVLIKHFYAKNFDERSRYLLRSLGNSPFKLNGVLCYEAFVERGDVIDICFSRIFFPRQTSRLELVESEVMSLEMMMSKLNVMIEGETGTGKTTLAKKIHEESSRSGAFVHLNLSSFSPGLIESELFGHTKGAFTGAMTEKKGAILEANKGTLFLDEIDSLTPELQTKLLLFLDNHEVRSVGGNHSVVADVRLIFASGTPLKSLLNENKMRRDFYYRLTSGIIVALESLRHSPEKILAFCQEFEKENYCVLSEELLGFYQECPWPGNIRQLYSHLRKKKILAGGKKLILDNHDYLLKEEMCSDSSYLSQNWKTLEQLKLDYSQSVFNRSEKNLTKAAKVLDISTNTLKAMLAKSRDHQIVDVNF